MSLLRLTSTYADGRTKPLLINSDHIQDIEPDVRENVPSKSIMKTKNGRTHYLAESIDEITASLNS